MLLKKNQELTVDITSLGINGEGIAKIDGYPIFIKGVLPGEKVNIAITKVTKNFSYARVLNILSFSSDREDPLCPVAGKCGGCTLQHLKYDAQLIFKRDKVKNNIERIGGFKNIEIEPTIGASSPYKYRNKAQYPVSEKNGEMITGFYAENSHRIVPCENCVIGPEINSKIINILKKENIPPYSEEKHSGLLRHIVIRHGFKTDDIMVILVINANSLMLSEECITELKKIGVTSIFVCSNTKRTNVILSNDIKCIYGEDHITEKIEDLSFKISPLSFFQVNTSQTEVLYSTALGLADVTPNKTVIDAYCGTGTISLFIARKAKKVYGVEIVEEAIDCAKENAKINNINNAEFFVGKSEEIVPFLCNEKGISPDIVFVDPPRKGCDASLLEMLKKVLPDKIVYISCDSATLARDLKILCQDNDYKIEKVQPVDMFPHTAHIETVCLLSRKS